MTKRCAEVESIKVDGENVNVLKLGILTQVMIETRGGGPATFKEIIGTAEVDCVRLKKIQIHRFARMCPRAVILFSCESGTLGFP